MDQLDDDLERRLALLLRTGKAALETGADCQRVQTLLQRLSTLLGIEELHLLFVVLRTVIAYFLNKEIQELREQMA